MGKLLQEDIGGILLETEIDYLLANEYDTDLPSNGATYYLGLFTSQYQNSTKLKAFAQVFLDKLQDITDVVDALFYYFDLDEATGDQLDIVGQLLGQSRYVNFEPTDGSSPKLDDETYRVLLKCKVLNNHWDGKINSLQDAWKLIFPSGNIVVQDNQDMTMSVIVYGEFTSKIIDLIQNGYVVPRPEGVLINIYTGTLPMLGFDRDDNYIAGFDTGYWT